MFHSVGYISILIFLQYDLKLSNTPPLMVFGNLTAEMWSAIVWTPKRNILAWFRVKKKIKKKRPYISHVYPDAPLQPFRTTFLTYVCFMDVMNCVKFCRNWFRGLDIVRGRILVIPIGFCRRRNTGCTSVRPVMKTQTIWSPV